MPGRKRPAKAIEDMMDDSNDEDYDNTESQPRKRKTAKRTGRDGPPRKKRRPGYGSASDGLSDDDLGSDSFEAESEDAEPEINQATGRPMRSTTKQKPKYEEPSSEDEAEQISSMSDAQQTPKKRTKMVKLKVTTPQPTPGPATRTLRGRSGSSGQKRPISEAPPAVGKRRSSRHLHDDDTLVALTGSGHHAEVVREGTRSPDLPTGAFKGPKGLKAPSKSTIDEGEEEDSSKSKEVLEIQASQNGTVGSDAPGEKEGEVAATQDTNGDHSPPPFNIQMSGADVIQESQTEDQNEEVEVEEEEEEGEEEEDEEEDEEPVSRRARPRKGQQKDDSLPVPSAHDERPTRRSLRSNKQRSARSSRRRGQDESSDFEPNPEDGGEESVSSSDDSKSSPRKGSQRVDEDESSDNRRPTRLRRGAKDNGSNTRGSGIDDIEEIAAEIAELRRPRRTRAPSEIVYEDKPRRNRKQIDYRVLRPELAMQIEEPDQDPPTPPRRARGGGGGGGWQRPLLATYGPFGGADGPAPVLGGASGPGAVGGVDSDSSDDETTQRPQAAPGTGLGGTVGMTPTSAYPPNLGLYQPQAVGNDPFAATSGTPANVGKREKQSLADIDPLGVDQNVSFDSVGGLQDHIDHLKEMVALPLLYPEVFQRFHIVPPRGVLFHGPPGTGKTLLARALASSVSSQGRKVTFYMRKGADALSKWVGEAERQLRLLFDEAKKNQPSIIFFDEIDGLAPVRSSKQEQIHASIVSTLLALMDGMDGRGQVIVIGATNRPDSIDPALRRPGRFDREFFFPLPNTEARRAILDIHTRGWEPPLPPTFKDELADLTKGYGGADLRALCTEAALNAVQRRYPQIYRSNEKLLIDPTTINIGPKDFLISIKNIVPSSQRVASSGGSPLPKGLEPLLRSPLSEIEKVLADAFPRKKTLTALEEAQYEDHEGVMGFKAERMQQEFERSRIFRPRLLIRGAPGLGQQYLACAVLNHLEGVHVQSFDLATLLEDSTVSTEAAVVRLFQEVKRRKPSVIYMPNVQSWYEGVGATVVSTFLGLLRSLPPTDPILVLGILESEANGDHESMLRDLFGYSRKNRYSLSPPHSQSRYEFFNTAMQYLKTAPDEFPDPATRKKRKLEVLKPAPPPAPKEAPTPTKEELKAQKKKDRQTLNILKTRIQPIMDQMKKYKKFRFGVIDENQIRYLYDEDDPGTVTSDLPVEIRSRATFRPFEKAKDTHGEPGLLEVATGKFYYNLELVTIEKRLSNGYYKRPKDFLADVKRMAKDAKVSGDQDRHIKANVLLANVEVDIGGIEQSEPALNAECERVYVRELQREKEAIEKAKRAAEAEGMFPPPTISANVAHGDSETTNNASTGPVVLGEPFTNTNVAGGPATRPGPVTPSRPGPSQISSLTNGYSVDRNDLNDMRPRSNDSSHSSTGDMDVAMTGTDISPQQQETQTQSSSFGQSAQPRPVHSYTAPLQVRQQAGISQPLSQKSSLTPMVPGSQPQDYINEASTTTSGKKSSDQNSGPPQNTQSNTQNNTQNNTQSTNGVRGHGPDLSLYPDASKSYGDENLPDTQNESDPSVEQPSGPRYDGSQGSGPSSSGPNSSNSQRHINSQPNSSQPPVPPFDAPPVHRQEKQSSIHNLVNTEEIHPTLMLDGELMESVHQELTQGTSGFGVEQLEQVNTAIMECIWRLREDWNRNRVAVEVRAVFGECVADMSEVGQDLGVPSGNWQPQSQPQPQGQYGNMGQY